MLQKQSLNLNFSQGLDTKTDAFQVAPGKFLSLSNGVFNKGGQLQKRNGYGQLASLPNDGYSYLTTFSENLTAVGESLAAYSSSTDSWVVKSALQPVSIDTIPLVRNNTSQTQCDSVIAPNGLVCTVYTDQNPSSLSTPIYKYVIADSVTGQNIVAPTAIPVATGTITNAPRVFLLSTYFIIMFGNVIAGTTHLQYVAVSVNSPTSVTAEADISSQFTSSTRLAYDAIVIADNLYIAWNGSDGGGAIRMTYIDNRLNQYNTAVFTGKSATIMSLCADTSASFPIIYVSFWDSGASKVYVLGVQASGTPVTFTSVFSATDASLTVSSAAGLVIGQQISDLTTPANLASPTEITNIVGSVIDITPAAVGSSAVSPGDTLVQQAGLNQVLAPTEVVGTGTVLNLASAVQSGVVTVYYELSNNYSYDSTIPTHFIKSVTCTSAGVVGTPVTVIRSLGLASKAFIVNDVQYFVAAYQSTYQPTYFVVNGTSSTSARPIIVAKLAYQNGGGYLTTGLPSVHVSDTTASFPYLYKDLIQAVNKLTNAPTGTPTNGIYAQTGVNLASVTFTTDTLNSAEIGGNLQLTGGFLWSYDGYLPVENGFFLYPDNVETTTATTGGGLKAQTYFYQAAYEWADNQGNIYRSAPSIPIERDLSAVTPSALTFTAVFSSGATTMTVSSASGLFIGQVITDSTTPANVTAGTYITSISGTTIGVSLPFAGNSAGAPGDTIETVQTSSNAIKVPTLRTTYKISNPVKIVIYRWSTAQQTYYQCTSLTLPTLNDTTADSISFTDTSSDQAILGNNILYTTGGVLENIAAPASNIMTLFDSRLWLLDAEDKNLFWYSKQVIETTPVEMSDLLTLFIAPTTGTQGSTGPTTAASVMDDKLIAFKKNAIYYVNGSGPDNTGANSQYSQPIFITSTVGCDNQKSIVFMPQGLMFQSDKGIWLLGRNLETSYIGAPVEQFNGARVLSAVNVPQTNQVRFTLDSGVTLMYDYYYNQWGTFTNVPAISSTIYQGLHTFINSLGMVYKESENLYLDGSRPVLMSFQTAWFNLAGLQGFQRAYEMYILGTYVSPHKLSIGISYDYNNSPEQFDLITPDNYSPPWGGDSLYGGSPVWGGASNIEQWRIFFQRQKCQSFSITLNEQFDYSMGTAAGAGLILHGLDLTVGVKATKPKLSASRQTG